jgi:hypothetical protein
MDLIKEENTAAQIPPAEMAILIEAVVRSLEKFGFQFHCWQEVRGASLNSWSAIQKARHLRALQ